MPKSLKQRMHAHAASVERSVLAMERALGRGSFREESMSHAAVADRVYDLRKAFEALQREIDDALPDQDE